MMQLLQIWFGEEKPAPAFYDVLLPALPKVTLNAELSREHAEDGTAQFKYYRMHEIGRCNQIMVSWIS